MWVVFTCMSLTNSLLRPYIIQDISKLYLNKGWVGDRKTICQCRTKMGLMWKCRNTNAPVSMKRQCGTHNLAWNRHIFAEPHIFGRHWFVKLAMLTDLSFSGEANNSDICDLEYSRSCTKVRINMTIFQSQTKVKKSHWCFIRHKYIWLLIRHVIELALTAALRVFMIT